MENRKENKMGTMPVPKLVISMSLPIMVSMLIQSLYNIVDSIFVARISEDALTATSIAYSAQMLQIAVAVGTGVGVNALVSRYLGAKKYKEADEAATTGLVLTIISSLVFVMWGIFGTELFIRQFTSNSSIIQDGTVYLKICQLFCTGLFLGTITQRLLQATGRTFLSMLAQMVGAVVNIILDPIMIFGLLGCPAMGICGAAIATVIGQWMSAVLGLVLNFIQNKEIHFRFKEFRMNMESIKQIYKVGAPTILTQGFGSIMIGVMNMILVSYGEISVAFFGAYFKLQSFLFMPMNGLGQGSLPIVGYNYGAKNQRRIKQTCKCSIMIATGIAVIATLIFGIMPRQLLLLFSASEGMIEIGIPALRIISLTFALSAVTMMIGYFLSGLGNGMVNMISTAMRQVVVLLPVVYLLGKAGGISVVWYAFWISELCAFAYAVLQMKKGLKQISE